MSIRYLTPFLTPVSWPYAYQRDAYGDLIRTLPENPDERVRAMVAWVLGKIGGEAARSALLAARGSDSRAVDAEVAQALVADGRVR